MSFAEMPALASSPSAGANRSFVFCVRGLAGLVPSTSSRSELLAIVPPPFARTLFVTTTA